MRSELRAVCMILPGVLVGCGKPLPVASRPLAATAAPSAAAGAKAAIATRPVAAAPATAAPALRTGPVGPAPTAAPPLDADRLPFATAACAASRLPSPPWMKPARVLVGCKGPPPYTKPATRPDGRVRAHVGAGADFCSLETVYRGSFSRPGAKQAVLAFDPCRSEDSEFGDMAQPGSGLLMEEVDGKWKAGAVLQSTNVQKCLQIPRPGSTDVLLCQSNFGAFSTGRVDYWELVEFSGAEPSSTQVVRVVSDDLNCMMSEYPDFELASGFTRAAFKSPTLVDLNRDGILDLVVEVVRAHAPAAPRLTAAARALCKQDQGTAGSKLRLPTAVTHRLELLSNGQKFELTAPSQALINAWEAENPASQFANHPDTADTPE